MGNLENQASQVNSRDTLANLVDQLRKDLEIYPEQWENVTLDSYLEALSAWLRDMDGYYKNRGEPLPVTPAWKTFAEVLLAAKWYE
jgi:hypothetical protein